MSRRIGGGTTKSRKTPSGELREPKFVTFHPQDTGAGLDVIFWEGKTILMLL